MFPNVLINHVGDATVLKMCFSSIQGFPSIIPLLALGNYFKQRSLSCTKGEDFAREPSKEMSIVGSELGKHALSHHANQTRPLEESEISRIFF